MVKSTDVGEKIRAFRRAKHYSRDYFAEMIGISVSHLEKIEAGDRRPGIGTFFKILDVLDADIVMYEEDDTVEQYISRVRDIFRHGTESQALFMLKVVERMAECMHILANPKE